MKLLPNSSGSSWRVHWPAILSCLFFFLAGLAFIPYLGLQNDEALFAYAIYEPRAGVYMVPVFGANVPLMLMSYLGTLKGWLYRQIFRAVRPGLYSIRVPMLLAGVWTLWLFYKLLRRTAGHRAAVCGCLLLAADSIFLLTIAFDWGPVALQHLFLISGLLLAVKFHQEKSEGALAGAFFLFGLGMWDKALMAWMLTGVGIAALLVFPRQIFRALTLKRLGTAVVAFGLGATPLIVYNATHEWETFRGNAKLDFTDIPNKAHLLASSLTGEALFGWMVAEDHEVPHQRAPWTLVQKASFAVSAASGQPRHSLMIAALALALLLAPLARGNDLRAILFCITAMVVSWLQMAVTKNAGGSVHHAVLIWPLPHFLVGVSLAAASRRVGRWGTPALAIVLVILLVPSLLVMNQYYVQEIRNGGAINWTDAIVPLAVYMREAPSSNVFCVDWGILDSIRLLNRGRTPVRVGSDPISKPSLTDEDRARVLDWIKEPDHFFIAHSQPFEFFQGTNAKLTALAQQMGYRRELLREVPDSFGRTVYEVYRFRREVPETTSPPSAAAPAHE